MHVPLVNCFASEIKCLEWRPQKEGFDRATWCIKLPEGGGAPLQFSDGSSLVYENSSFASNHEGSFHLRRSFHCSSRACSPFSVITTDPLACQVCFEQMHNSSFSTCLTAGWPMPCLGCVMPLFSQPGVPVGWTESHKNKGNAMLRKAGVGKA